MSLKMKPIAAAAASLALLAGGLAPAASADARTPVTLTVNGSPMSFPDESSYEADGTVYVPIRAAAERLGFAVSYDADAHTVGLASAELEVSFQAGSADAAVNGTPVSFAPASVAAPGRVFVPLSFFERALGLDTAYRADARAASIGTSDAPAPEANAAPEAIVEEVVQLLADRSYQQLSDAWFTDELKTAVPVEALAAAWESAAQAAGAWVGVSDVRTAPLGEGVLSIEAVAEFERASFRVSLAVDGSQKLAGILLQPAAPAADVPAGVAEEAVTVGEGTAFELGGTLTLPADADGPVPAVVLVQGSGPSDRDETAGAYKPFRDIAWGLAQRGIAVLRYDKRTYAYGDSFTPEQASAITVAEESVDDAVAAAELLKADDRIDNSQVYLIGHSQGGMLAPRIDAEGGDFAGLVLLAGSPRTLWDIIYDQNMAIVEAMDDADPAKEASRAYVEAEYAKAQSIAAMTDEEAMASAAFGIPAYYFKEMDSFDLRAYAAAATDKPLLVLQGEDDFQIYADKDYVQYQEIFGDRHNVEFKLYPGLNHFFVDYSGPGEGTTAEYNVPGTVSEVVIADIADWLLRRR